MESLQKIKLSPEQIDRILRETLQEKARSIQELADGWANTGYRVELESGRTLMLKAAPAKGQTVMRSERDTMRVEVEVTRLLTQKQPEVPVPHIYVYDPSCSLVPCEYFIKEYLDAEPYNKVKDTLSTDEQEQIEEELGRYNRMINSVTGEQFGYFLTEYGAASTWRDGFHLLMHDLLQDGKDAGIELPLPYSVVEHEIEVRLDAFEEVKVPQLIHWDLWEGNLFVKDNHVVGIIDFERSLWGDPLFENFFGKFHQPGAFRRGYGKLHLTETEQIRRELYDLHLDLVQYIECTYRGYQNKGHIEWARANLANTFELLIGKSR
ncbi:aminoglycoside phosphotransferase family protein [Gorillibacterium sp. CAU 1737]|uniref:phosphotransferase family protein n=1 Tax=Gorillibacterium sp. CAU 1737 TaxID=3140362 RepID=UPI003261BCA2